MTDFFDLDDNNFVNKGGGSKKKVDDNIYNPDPDKFNGSYKSVFRFLPYIHDKSMSKYTKYTAKFWNPLTKESLFVDCPSNWGDPSILWDAATVIHSLKEEEPELWKELDNRFSRWFNHHSAIYIKKDPQRPDLEGQVKVFKFTKQVDNFIEEQLNPEDADLVENAVKINPYHLLQGKDFVCIVGKKTKFFRDWTKCKFVDDVTPFIFKVGDKTVKVENSEKSIKLVQEFLKKYTPTFDDYMWTKWTEDTYGKVAESMVSCINNKAVIKMILDRTKDTKTKDLILAKMAGTTSKSSKPSIDADEDLTFKSEEKPSIDTPLEEAKSDAKEPATAEAGNDEYDDLFKDM